MRIDYATDENGMLWAYIYAGKAVSHYFLGKDSRDERMATMYEILRLTCK